MKNAVVQVCDDDHDEFTVSPYTMHFECASKHMDNAEILRPFPSVDDKHDISMS